MKTRKLLVIVTEASIENTLIEDLKEQGVKGYTIVRCEGEGSRGTRRGNLEQNKNIKITTVCSEELADKLIHYIHENYYENYAMISYISDVLVSREAKFS